MENAKTSNGVNANRRQEMAVQRDANIKRDIAKFTGDSSKTINTNCTLFDVKPRELEQNNSTSGATDTNSGATARNATIETSNPVTQTLANVELAGLYIKAYELEKEKDLDEEEKENESDRESK